MAPNRTRTIKNKHAASKSGVAGSRIAKNAHGEGMVKSKKPNGSRAPIVSKSVKGRPNLGPVMKRKKKVYSEKELAIPELNRITPIGVQKPKGQKKGKVFVDDRESMSTILAIVQAEKEGQIESRMIKARQMEEIREARTREAEAKEAERKAKFDETKESLRKKRKRPGSGIDGHGDDDDRVWAKSCMGTGMVASRSKTRRKVAFSDG